jgi:uncharacterized delta-60 repeat protein
VLRLRLGWGLLAIAIAAVWASPALGAPGDLDPTFGSGGIATYDGVGRISPGNSLAVQPDGKALVSVTRGSPADSDIAVLRVTPQGAPDTSFGGGTGIFDLNISTSDDADQLVLQPDGKIDVVGSTGVSGGFQFVLARLLSQGTLDTGFASPNGFRVAKYTALGVGGSTDLGHALALQGSKIIVAGASDIAPANSFDFAVTRVVSPDGARDSFGNSGDSTFLDLQTHSTDEAFGIAVQPDGRIVVSGTSTTASGSSIGVVRLSPDGQPDGSFGAGGTALVPGANGRTLAIQPDGKIVVLGDTSNIGPGAGDVVVERLDPNGTPDGSFGSGGRATFDFGGDDEAFGIALQKNGKIVVAGTDLTHMSVARLQPDGQLDSTFAKSGVATIAVGPNAGGSAVAVQDDGKIVVAGDTINAVPMLALARLQGDPVRKGKCAGKKATIVGTNGRDKLKGTRKRDVISAGKGKDKVKGLKGNDIICGGKGRDKLIGGPGKDKLLGQQGNDKLLGGPGKDKLKGGPGKRDKLRGGPGKDFQKP